MESFFSSMKTERIGRKVYRSRDAARPDVFDYIERFYNTTRRHSTIGYVSRLSSKGRSECLNCCPSNRQQAKLLMARELIVSSLRLCFCLFRLDAFL
jgi:Integrase core domain